MKDFTKKQQEWLKKTFPAGEYTVLTLMVRNDEISKLTSHLKNSNVNLCMFSGVKSMLEFNSSDTNGTEQ